MLPAIGFIALVLVGLVVIVFLWIAGTYNSLIRLRNQLENAWAQIDVQLKRRHDLIPNLVETVKGYAKHESGTLEAVIQARNMAVSAKTVGERAEAENVLTGALKSLFAVAEAYPDLKANQNFLALQEELTSTENKISFSRQFYNDTVMTFNTRLEVFPTNVIAGMFHFARHDFFEVKAEEEREAPKVQF
ncbi:MAG TPA: LemA family protein [Verrucomicrobiae bacterium]|nr:LemA family protein [Verrucomicrobiae bacterium]